MAPKVTRFHVARLSVFAFLILSSVATLGVGAYLLPTNVEVMMYPILAITVSAFTFTGVLIEMFVQLSDRTSKFLCIACEIGWMAPAWIFWLVVGALHISGVFLGDPILCDARCEREKTPNQAQVVAVLSFLNAAVVLGWWITLIVIGRRTKKWTYPIPVSEFRTSKKIDGGNGV